MGLLERRIRSNTHPLLLLLPLLASVQAQAHQSQRYHIPTTNTPGQISQGIVPRPVSYPKRRQDFRTCKGYLMASDANSDDYLTQLEYVDWLDLWLIHPETLQGQFFSSFEALPLELQDLYDRYAFLYSDTDQIDIHGIGSAHTAGVDLLCQEASDLVSDLSLPTKTTTLIARAAATDSDTTGTTIRELQGDVSVVDVLAIHGETTTLVELLDQADLSDTLRGKGPFTVFAPTNDAFEALDLTRLEKAVYKDHLVDLLTYHVAPDLVLYSGLVAEPGQEMLNGQTINLTSVDPPMLNFESNLIVPDLLGDNGIVHFIDAVLLPPSYTMDAVTAAVVDPDLSILVELLTKAGLVETLQGEGPFTIFAPTNAAFEQTDLVDSLVLGENEERLSNLLNQHVTTGIWLTDDMEAGMPFLMSNSHFAIVSLDPSPRIDNATIVEADRLVKNGVIHIIDTVLVPEDPTLSPSSTPSVAQSASPSSTPTALPTTAVEEETSPPAIPPPTSLAPTITPSLAATTGQPSAGIEEESPNQTGASPPSEPPTPSANDQTTTPTIATVLAGGDQQLEVTIVEVLAIHGETTTLVEKLDEAGLIDVLRGKGPFTVFAPTNEAFDSLDLTKLETDEYRPHFVDLLTYHVAPELLLSSGLVFYDGPDMLNGQTINITSLEPPVINFESIILVPDLLGENGIVHFIDTVLLPPSYTMGAVEAAMANPELSTFVELLTSADLVPTLQGEGPFTIFAPTNAAFEQLGIGVSTRDAQMDMLLEILTQHVTQGILVADKWQDGATFTMMNGNDTIIGVNPSLMIDDASVIDSDILVKNGVIHIIDKVLGSSGTPASTSSPTTMPPDNNEPTGTQMPEERECLIDMQNINDSPSPPENPITVLATDGLTATFTVSQTWFSQTPAQHFVTIYLLPPDGETGMCHRTNNEDYGVVDTYTAWCDESTKVADVQLLVEDDRFEDYGVPIRNCEGPSVVEEGRRVGISIAIPCHCDPGEMISNFAAGSIISPTFMPTGYNSFAPTAAPAPAPTPAPTQGESPTDDFVTPEPAWDTVWEVLQDNSDLSLFWSALEAVNINNLLSASDLDFTVFAPSNSDVMSVPALMFYSENVGSWTGHTTIALQHHIVAENSVTSAALWNGQFGDMLVMLSGEPLEVDANIQQVGGQVIASPDLWARNGVVHLLGGVLDPGWFQLSLIEVLEELSPLPTRRRSLQTSGDFNVLIERLDSTYPEIRDELSILEEEGITFVAPRDGAFSDANEGDLDDDYILYHIVASNVYRDSGSVGLLPTRHPVADVWVTHDVVGGMRYNGVAVQSEWLAQNGVIHVTERILEPPTMFEMLEIADGYTNYNTSTLLEFFLASGWDLNNLSGFLGMGEGQRLTLIAPMNNNFDMYLFTEGAKERLLTPLWSRHLEDMLMNLLAGTPYTKSDIEEELSTGWEGYFVLEMLGGQFNDIYPDGMISAGYFLDDSPSCVDGIIHFVDSIMLPPSVSGGVFDVLYSRNHSYHTVTFLDFLGQSEVYWDLAYTEVMTMLVPLDTAFDTTDMFAQGGFDDLIRHHTFQEMLFTDQLLDMEGESLTSMAGSEWTVGVNGGSLFISNEDGLTIGIETSGNDLLVMNGVVHVIDSLMVSSPGSPQSPDSGFNNPATNPTMFPSYIPQVSEGAPSLSRTPSPTDTGASYPTATPAAGEPPTGGHAGSPGSNDTGRPTGSTGGDPPAQTPTPGGDESPRPTMLDQISKSPPQLLETSFGVFNQKGLSASDLAKSDNVSVLNTAFIEFLTVLASEVEGQQRKLQAAATVRHSRRLLASLVPESAKIYGVADMACSTGGVIPKDATCQKVYGHYELYVQDEDATAVESRYETAIQNAIEAGKLQESVDEVAPNWTFKVVAIADAPEDKGSKMAWWVIGFIVLACVFGCAGFCCIGAYFSARSKEETARRAVEEIQAPLFEGSVHLINSECSNKDVSETSSGRPPTDETDGPERSNRSDESAFEDEANSQGVYPSPAMVDSFEDNLGRNSRSTEKEDDFTEGDNESWEDDGEWEDGDAKVAKVSKDDWGDEDENDEDWEEDDESEGSFCPQGVDAASHDYNDNPTTEIDDSAGTERTSPIAIDDEVNNKGGSEEGQARSLSQDSGMSEEPANSKQVGSARAIEARRKFLEKRRLQAESDPSDALPPTPVAAHEEPMGAGETGDETENQHGSPNISVQSQQVGSARAIEARERFLQRRRLRAAEESPDAAATALSAPPLHEEAPPEARKSRAFATDNAADAPALAHADEVSVDSQQVGSARAIEARRKFLERRRLGSSADDTSDNIPANEQPKAQSEDVTPQEQREDEGPRLGGNLSSDSIFYDAAPLEGSSSSESMFHEASETPLCDEFVGDASPVHSFEQDKPAEESDSEVSDGDSQVPELQSELAEVDRLVSSDPRELEMALTGASDGELNDEYDGRGRENSSGPRKPPPNPPTNADGGAGWLEFNP